MKKKSYKKYYRYLHHQKLEKRYEKWLWENFEKKEVEANPIKIVFENI